MIEIQLMAAVTAVHGRLVAFETRYVKDMEHLVRYAHVNFMLACAMLILMSCSLYVSNRLKRAQQTVAAAMQDLAVRQSAVIEQMVGVAGAQTDVINHLIARVAALEAKLGINPPLPPTTPPPQVLM